MYYDLIGINEGENKELLNIYTKETIRRIKAQLAETKTMCKNNIETLIKNRDEIVEKVFKYKNEDGVKAPIAFQYIIQNIQGQLNLLPTSAVDITPMEFFEMCNETMNKLKLMFKPTRMFEIMFQYYLSPKEILIKKRFNRTAVALLMENIILTYKKSVVHPGEMVGVIAGQSIGEPTTQLTLNSFVYETEILVRNSAGEIKCVQIGDFTKWGIASSRKLDYMEDKDTTYAELSEYYEVPSATEDGETVWRRIEAVTKHPVINEDGTNTMLKVTTKGCRELIATKAKSFLKLVDGKIVGIEGKDLKVGDYLPVSKKALVYTEKTHLESDSNVIDLDYNFGYDIGTSCLTTINKEVLDKIVFSNRQCVLGFLDAFIDGSSRVNINENQIEIVSVSHSLLTIVQLMLKNLGIISQMNCDSLDEYTLIASNGQSKKLAQILKTKHSQLLEQTFKYDYCKSDLKIPNEVNGEIIMELRDGRCEDLEFDKIVSIEEVSNTTDYAYDLTVEDTRNFDCMNGLCVRDTFHLAGVATKSNVTRGVPRIEEILRLTRNPDKPSATVFLKPIDQHDKDKATNYCNMIQHTKLIDVVKSVEICFDPNDKNTKIIKDQDLISQFYDFEEFIGECGEGKAAEVPKSKWIVRMEIDTESLLDKNITMDDIHYAISASHGNDVSCVFSDMNSSNLVFRIRINASVFNKGKKKGVTESLDQSDEIYLLKNFQDNLLNNIVLRGVNGITNVNPRMLKDMLVKEDSKFVRKDMWVLDTVGTNLQDLFMLDFIDYARTYSNDIREIYNTLGIEATRQNILNEFNEVMEASDAYVNYHHLSILCDRMTVKADLVPMFRSGIMNDDIGPISKGTYEMHTEMFLDASRHGDFDQMRGVSANVMCGQTGFYGTSAFSLLLDMNAIKELDDSEVVDEDLRKNIDEHFAVANEDTKCDMKKINIDNNVKNIKATDMGDCNDAYSLF
jgi:DNA-directed RNA polymerase beta' subunit